MKYQVWNKKDRIIVPTGKVYTAEEWIVAHPIAGIFDTVISGNKINGSILMVYDEMIEMYAKKGVDFSKCKTQQEHLDAIEVWEDEQASKPTEPDNQTRIADALQDLVVLSMPDDM